MPSYGCMNYVGDEDCAKCLIYGILLNGCHYKCEEYEDIFGNKPNKVCREEEKRKYTTTKGENNGTDETGTVG